MKTKAYLESLKNLFATLCLRFEGSWFLPPIRRPGLSPAVNPDYAAQRRSKIDKDRSGLALPLRSDSEIEADLNLENFDLYRSTQESIDLYRSTQIFIFIFIDLLIREYESANYIPSFVAPVFVTFHLFHFQERVTQHSFGESCKRIRRILVAIDSNVVLFRPTARFGAPWFAITSLAVPGSEFNSSRYSRDKF